MKKGITKALILFTLLLNWREASAQCDPAKKYDKIVSGYHQSIALQSDGKYNVWGQNLAADGASDLLVPTEINATNFPGLTGTPLKTTIGGPGNSSGEQAVLLSTTGLFAWGPEAGVLSTSLTTNTSFQKIAAPTNADASTGLPSGVTPTDVDMLVASYKTLALLTKTGQVWILTQMSAALQGDGTALSATTWHQVKTDATTALTNISEIRGQVSTASASAFLALARDGKAYTWGSSVYLGDGTAAQSKSFATPMTLPAEFSSSNLPSMIGVTGGTKGSNTVLNTYFLVSPLGSLYALGDNDQKQCGDFTTTERLTWVKSMKTSTQPFTDIRFISVQEHDASFPAVSAVGTDGGLYTWGQNGGMMLGRNAESLSYDPGYPNGYTAGSDFALFSEIGGHTMLYLKTGYTRFCYVGHKISGSMGDGLAIDNIINVFDCLATPAIEICGAVPVVPSPITSTISTNKDTINADGISTATITIQLKDASGNNLTSSGGTVTVSTSLGSLGTVIDNNDGTYTVVLTSASTAGKALINYTLNGVPGTASTSVVFASASTPPAISLQPITQSICEGQTLNFSVTATASAGGSLSYQWRKLGVDIAGANLASFSIANAQLSDAGKYDVVVKESGTNLSVTSAEVQATVVAKPSIPTITAGGSTTLCQGNSVQLSSSAGTSYQWYLGASAISGATTQNYTATQSGNYSVTVTNTGGCSNTSAPKTVTVQALPPTPSVVASGALVFCNGGNVVLNAPLSANYQWYVGGAPLAGAISQTLTVSSSGSYSVVVGNATGCKSSASSVVTVNVLPIPAAPAAISGPVTTFPTRSNNYSIAVVPGASTYNWTLPSGWTGASTSTSIAATAGSSSGIISVTASANGCTGPATTLAVTIKLFVADVLTPNRDGKNDQWMVMKPSNLSIKATIYNRWGQIVYQSSDYNNGFNGEGTGNFLGKQLPNGTYFYLLDITDRTTGSSTVEKGSLTLKRDN